VKAARPQLSDAHVNATTTPAASRRPTPRDTTKILGDCRDLAVKRLLAAFSAILDKVGEVLMDRASRTDVRDEQQLFLDARATLMSERKPLMAEFERRLKKRIDDKISGQEEVKADFSKVDIANLTLVDTQVMDESVITGNITRVVENLCYDELQTLNRGIGHLMGQPDLETDGNPLAPEGIVTAFADALKLQKSDERVKFQILKELNQGSLSDLNGIYQDLNKHLLELHVVPGARGTIVNPGGGERQRTASAKADPKHPAPPPEVDVMAMFRRMFASGQAPMPQFAPPAGGAAPPPAYGAAPAPAYGAEPPPPGAAFPGAPGGGAPMAGAGERSLDFPSIDFGGAGPMVPSRYIPSGPMAPTSSGYIPGAPIISTPMLGEGLSRLQAGESGFDLGGGAVQFSGIPAGMQNVLRDLQDSPLGQRANQLESMTIEMVAMLFDFIFETRDLPDGIKALLARLQIPVLKAAMLDGAFFARKTHPSRVLVNALAEAGLGWSPEMGNDDPLYRKLDEIVHRILNDFTDNLELFEELHADIEAFLADEEKAAEANIATTAEEINLRDRREIAVAVSRAEIEKRIEQYPVPNFLATFLRQRWSGALEHVYLQDGEESDAWGQGVATLEDLVWSVQPKKTSEDRRHLIALLPSLLKRMSGGLQSVPWPTADREQFMSNLVEAHAAAVKPSLAAVALPTAAVAEQAKAEAEVAKAAGDDVAAARAEALALAMTQAEPAPVEPEPEVLDDEYLEIARSLDRGMWIEFEAEDGQLAFAKLAWVSPLRGTYLFTNRQGQKALSMTAEELAERFRHDQARLVEAEPLIDRAFSNMMTQMNDKFADVPAA
jgi:hypothetical protein